MLTGSYDKTARLWDAATGKLVRSFDGHKGWVSSVAFSPDGRQVLTGSYDKTARLWDSATGTLVRSFEAYSDWISSVAASPDGRHMLTGSRDNTAKLWDAATGTLVRSFAGHPGVVGSVAFSPDSRQVLTSSSNNTARLWDATTGMLVRSFEGNQGQTHSEVVGSVAFSPDGRQVLTGAWNDAAKLWDATTGKVLRSFNEHSGGPFALAFSPDGRQVLAASGAEGGVLRSTAMGTVLHRFKEPSDSVSSVAFSSDGRRVLTGGWDDTAKLWDAATGALLRSFEGNSVGSTSVAFSPDGRQALTGSRDNTARLWDTAAGTPMRIFEGYFDMLTSVAFSTDGRQVLTGSRDTTTRIWSTETGELLVTLIASRYGEWLVLTPEGFFNASSPEAARLLGIVRSLNAYSLNETWQSLYAPDLVREKLTGDQRGEIAKAAVVINLEKVLDSGKAPRVSIASPASGANSTDEIITAEAEITALEGGGIGRVEWRVNGITVGVSDPALGSGGALIVRQSLALDPGANTIEVVAYNGRNLLASVPARATVTWTGTPTTEPNLYVLAIGINNYVDRGGLAPGETEPRRFGPLNLAADDAKAFSTEVKKAARGLYGEVHVQAVLNEQATAANLDLIVARMAGDISVRDTFVLFVAGHGYSYRGRFYFIPQDYQGGPDPQALTTRAIDQFKLQDWIANRIRAKKALILLDTCESGALTGGYTRSRIDGSALDAAIGRLHESTGRPVLTAAALGQDALELSELGHGVFTSAVIDSLYRGDTDGNGQIAVIELATHVQNLVPKLIKDPRIRAEVIKRGFVGGVQSARFGSRGEDFAFVHRLQ